jgi:Domain of unknown function (DUF4326)
MMPKRIQRRRVKGWRMPEGAVNCTRPGKWENPFVIGTYYMKGDAFGRKATPQMAWTSTSERYADERFTKIENAEQAVEWFRWYRTTYPLADIEELRGKDLACWCALDAVCHVDVLLELANA